jgi:hypothetical protein
LRYGFGDLVQNFELEMVGGAPNGYQLSPQMMTRACLMPRSWALRSRINSVDQPQGFRLLFGSSDNSGLVVNLRMEMIHSGGSDYLEWN